jgi:ATP-dependent helicase Lhr and Lhr-like helicase
MNEPMGNGRRKRPNMFKKREESLRKKEELSRARASTRKKRSQPLSLDKITGQQSGGRELVQDWFSRQGWEPFSFQTETWDAYLKGESGLIHSSTGTGKTFAIWPAPLIEWLDESLASGATEVVTPPITVLWLTPLRALAGDTEKSLREMLDGLALNWTLESRTGDTSASIKARQKIELPSALITTPESLSLLLSYAENQKMFSTLRLVVVDEWHELMGTKRGTMTELALARLRQINPHLRTWGMSATLGNTEEAMHTLCGMNAEKTRRITSDIDKETTFVSLLPESVEHFPWAGHLGLPMVEQVAQTIERAKTSLVFTNTRSQCEMWYQSLLTVRPDWAGEIALHHGSLDRDTRKFVEDAVRDSKLRCVVCTSSLDLGVDFAPVEQVLQLGSAKGVARLLQRAGRSGHKPGALSTVVCVPTHAFEIIEFAAARKALVEQKIESRKPLPKPLDVLSQHIVTLAVGGGFRRESVLAEIRSAYSFKNLSEIEFDWVLNFVTKGGRALGAYPEYCKVQEYDDYFIVESDSIRQRHRMSIGTITSDDSMNVVFMSGERIGSLEESFIARLRPGDKFVFAGRCLELVRTKDMKAFVRLAPSKGGTVPRWMGGRMPLSSELSQAVREELGIAAQGIYESEEMKLVEPLLRLQETWSKIPDEKSVLVEHMHSREGYHLFIYPFEGRLVHEGLAALLAYRMSRLMPATFSLSINDYGFEMVSNINVPVEMLSEHHLFNPENLADDILRSMNASEMARRRFREIARVAGLVFSGYPGKSKTSRQVQVSSGLLFDVFSEYDPENLLLHQAEREVLEQQLEESRLRNAMKRLSQSRLISVELERASPMALPLLVESWRGKVSSETIAERVSRMQLALAKKPSKSGTKRGGVSRVGASREGASRGGASRGSASRGGASRGGALHAPLRNPDKITTPGTNNKANS